MIYKRPTLNSVKKITEQLNITFNDEELIDFYEAMRHVFEHYENLDKLYIEDTFKDISRLWEYPLQDENIYNAWHIKTYIKSSDEGLLQNKKIALKDNIALAGVPMINGSSILEGYIPNIDATVVERILTQGAIIAGKANCEYFCFSGNSHTCSKGSVHNPYKSSYTAGGSSSGCAVLVATGDVDMAIGGDQGCSIRTPASLCGIVGLKPTFGLVPYTGIMSLERTIDHAGPMTRNVSDNAQLLEVLAGNDGLDPRQAFSNLDHNYTSYLNRDIKNIKIGIVKQGFGLPHSENDVDELVLKAADDLAMLGAVIEQVDIPIQNESAALWTAIGFEGAYNQLFQGDGLGTGWQGLYDIQLSKSLKKWKNRVNELSPYLKLLLATSSYAKQEYGNWYYGKAQNIRRSLTRAYDEKFAEYDILLMPTLPMKAWELPTNNSSLYDRIMASCCGMASNTYAFNLTGHPAISIPCGESDGLPIGMMLVAKHYGEGVIYQVASAYENSVYKPRLENFDDKKSSSEVN